MTSMMVLVCGLCRPSVRLFPLYLLNQQTLNQKCKKRTLQISQVEVVAELLLQSCARHTPLDGYACAGRHASAVYRTNRRLV